MKRIKQNQASGEVGNTYKVIAISLTVGVNIIISTWFFLFSGLTTKSPKKQEIRT
tara:strand:+ start:361 stop:525 length:165 start_codon:yes stop_codon:yes gene_type:complete